MRVTDVRIDTSSPGDTPLVFQRCILRAHGVKWSSACYQLYARDRLGRRCDLGLLMHIETEGRPAYRVTMEKFSTLADGKSFDTLAEAFAHRRTLAPAVLPVLAGDDTV